MASARSGEARDRAKVAREQQLLGSKLPIIAVFGQSGTGKSTFINLIASEKQKVGNGLQSCTREVSVVEAKIGGQSVVIVDMPGIDDTCTGVQEADVLKRIAKQLADMAQCRIWVTGVLFLHRISDNRFSHTAQRISTVLNSLCGNAAMKNLMLCATMWDRVPEDEGNNRFDELCQIGVWKDMIANGAGTAVISNKGSDAKTKAEKIVSDLIKNAQPVELAIQDEMINRKRILTETKAGKILEQHREKQAEDNRKVTELNKTVRKRRKFCIIQ